MYETLDGNFPNHEANPLHTETLDAIRAKVKETGAEFGAAFDGDADRCGFIDDQGNIIPMDLFTALIAQDILSDKGNGTVTILYDLRSSWAVRECIKENGGRPLMSRVGHAFIKQQMRENNAVFAGELSDTITSPKTTLRNPRGWRSSNWRISSAKPERRSAS